MGNLFRRAPQTYLCCECKQEFASLSCLEEHAYQRHADDTDFCGHKTFYCYGCRTQFNRHEWYVGHLSRGPKK